MSHPYFICKLNLILLEGIKMSLLFYIWGKNEYYSYWKDVFMVHKYCDNTIDEALKLHSMFPKMKLFGLFLMKIRKFRN